MRPVFFKKQTLFLLNILFWITLAVLDFLQGYAYAVRNEETFMWMDRFSYIFSYFFSYWILSFGVYSLFLKTHNFSLKKALKVHIPASFVFGPVHLAFSMLVSMSVIRTYFHFFPPEENPYTMPFLQAWWTNIKNWYPLIINGWMMYWILLGVLFALNFYTRYRDQYTHRLELESQLNQAQLQTLKMQLQPHFLFNALNTIAMMVRRQKSQEAIGMISGLSDLLRSTLSREGEQMVNLEAELELLKKYLDIEAIRFQDKLEVKWDIQESCKTAKVPSLILQPIVENAFKHGISRSLNHALICIESKCDQAFLYLTVINTGAPLPEGWNIEKDRGIGLSNTQGRLRQMYGENQQLSVTNHKNKGVKVEIKIPLKL